MYSNPLSVWISDVIHAVKYWIDVADWRSWIAHALVALPIAALFGVVPVFVLFTVREMEQLAFEVMFEQQPHWLDHLLDIVAPVAASLALVWLR